MLSEEIRQRLERLNRGRIPAEAMPPERAVVEPAPSALIPEATNASQESESAERPPETIRYLEGIAPPSRDDSDVALESLVRGEVVETLLGPHFLVRRPLVELWRGAAAAIEGRHRDVAPKNARRARHARELAHFAAGFPDEVLFLDLETCGLAGAPIFLAGVIRATGEGLALEQLLARDYSEERAMLHSLWERAAGCRVLATFNGKSFDWPMVHDRSTLHRLGRDMRIAARGNAALSDPWTGIPGMSSAKGGTAGLSSSVVGSSNSPESTDHHFRPLAPNDPRPELFHIDLLHHSRRRWRKRLPNCKLQTLERFLCRRVRQGDVPGHRIPQEYHHYVRTGDARVLRDVLHHNALDLITLVELSLRLLRPPETAIERRE